MCRSVQLPEVKLAIYSGEKKEGLVAFAAHVSFDQSADLPML